MKILINIPLIGLLISYLVFFDPVVTSFPMYQEKPCQNNLSLQYDFAKESLEVVIVLAIILQFPDQDETRRTAGGILVLQVSSRGCWVS